MASVQELEDRFARVAITVLRRTGLRIGELLVMAPGVFVHRFRSNPYTHSGVFVHPSECRVALP
jgi:hypothetical protein